MINRPFDISCTRLLKVSAPPKIPKALGQLVAMRHRTFGKAPACWALLVCTRTQAPKAVVAAAAVVVLAINRRRFIVALKIENRSSYYWLCHQQHI